MNQDGVDPDDGQGTRLKIVAKRKLLGCGNRKKSSSKLVLGSGANNELMALRACPGTDSPKRQTPMEVDVATPPKRQKGKTKQTRIDPNQQLLTDVWKLDANKDHESNPES